MATITGYNEQTKDERGSNFGIHVDSGRTVRTDSFGGHARKSGAHHGRRMAPRGDHSGELAIQPPGSTTEIELVSLVPLVLCWLRLVRRCPSKAPSLVVDQLHQLRGPCQIVSSRVHVVSISKEKTGPCGWRPCDHDLASPSGTRVQWPSGSGQRSQSLDREQGCRQERRCEWPNPLMTLHPSKLNICR